MMVNVVILAAGLLSSTADDMPLLPDAAAYSEMATEWLLDGRTLPPDYRIRLLEMSPEARMQTLIFLRRAGLLRADAWSLQDIMRPANVTEVPE
ncbi:hypothetical protein H4P12_08600 [Paracoccus sp. 11-3]|uniref:Uncharacterized protein n=1 Tax=Paracoccus amoyensis TaxID=2760093 RepID=A0A926GMT6_9RHOB|nr:hypothetical protein [Paracoccus amoyensis]MBC9246770.1 hypothetical protein [Paracoccus amoyensis]